VTGSVEVTDGGGARLTASAAVEIWSLTVLVHVAAGGGLPSVSWLVGLAGLVAISTSWVLRRAVRLPVMLPVLVLCQVGLHVSLEAMRPVAPVEHGHAMAGSAWWMHELTPRMVSAHAACALLTGVIWWLRRWVVRVVLILTRPLAIPVRHPSPALWWRSTPGSALVWLVGDPGRAPPRVLASA
jgi:hypothetical protein